MSATTLSTLESLIHTMTPDEAVRTAAAKHRKETEDWLTSDLGIIRSKARSVRQSSYLWQRKSG